MLHVKSKILTHRIIHHPGPACPKSGTPGVATSQILRDIKEMPHKIVDEIFKEKIQNSRAFNVAIDFVNNVPKWIGNAVGIFDSTKSISDGKSEECNSMKSSIPCGRKC